MNIPLAQRSQVSVSSIRYLRLACLIWLSITHVPPAHSQITPPLGAPVAIRPTPPVIAPVRIETQQNRALREEEESILDKATSISWLVQNPEKAARLQQLRLAVAHPQQPQMLELVEEVDIPHDASAIKEEFLVARAEAWNAYVEANNQALRLSPELREKTLEKSATANIALNQRLQDLAQALSDQRPSVPLPIPVQQHPPFGASPALRTFLAERNALALELYRASGDPASMASPAIRARFDAFHNLATQLSKENPTKVP